MDNYINLFKTDFFNGLIALSKKIWLKITYAYSIYYMAALVIGGIFAAIAIMGALDMDMFEDMIGGNPSPEDSLMLIRQIGDMIITPEFIISFSIIFIIMLVIASWNYYFAFITANTEINDDQRSFRDLLKLSMSVEVFKLVGITIVLNIIISLIFIAAVLSASLSGILALFMFIAASIFTMRLMLVVPAFVIGNYDFNSAFAFSFYHINWSRAFKFFGIFILAILVILSISVIIGLISAVFSFIPIIGPLIQIAINVFLGAIMMTITVSTLVGLYYRYADIASSDEDNTTALES